MRTLFAAAFDGVGHWVDAPDIGEAFIVKVVHVISGITADIQNDIIVFDAILPMSMNQLQVPPIAPAPVIQSARRGGCVWRAGPV